MLKCSFNPMKNFPILIHAYQPNENMGKAQKTSYLTFLPKNPSQTSKWRLTEQGNTKLKPKQLKANFPRLLAIGQWESIWSAVFKSPLHIGANWSKSNPSIVISHKLRSCFEKLPTHTKKDISNPVQDFQIIFQTEPISQAEDIVSPRGKKGEVRLKKVISQWHWSSIKPSYGGRPSQKPYWACSRNRPFILWVGIMNNDGGPGNRKRAAPNNQRHRHPCLMQEHRVDRTTEVILRRTPSAWFI